MNMIITPCLFDKKFDLGIIINRFIVPMEFKKGYFLEKFWNLTGHSLDEII